jgi:puromycin-sensitive aminopeptidase
LEQRTGKKVSRDPADRTDSDGQQATGPERPAGKARAGRAVKKARPRPKRRARSAAGRSAKTRRKAGAARKPARPAAKPAGRTKTTAKALARKRVAKPVSSKKVARKRSAPPQAAAKRAGARPLAGKRVPRAAATPKVPAAAKATHRTTAPSTTTAKPRPAPAPRAHRAVRPTPPPPKPRPEKGPRFTDSAFRLPPEVRPSDYRIHILPDLQQAKFRGEAIIEIDLRRAVPSIELHCAELTIDHAEVAYPDAPEPPSPLRNWGSAGQPPAGTGPISLPQTAVAIVPHASRETVEIKFLRPLAAGHLKLSLAFRGALQERLRGLYRASSGGRRYAFTQLEAADARRFFPCFDEPEYKARFTFSVTADTNVVVISNSPLERVDRNAYGTATRHFRPTPKLSTYLCALAVGELESSPERRVGKVPLRVWSVPGKAGLTAFALEAAAEALRRLEAYFDLPYPYEKLDLVAVPDFEAGAMENAGAVFFRETLLLVDPATITVAEKKRAAEVIAHELAHMWFGNLVTMRWWDDLWLNEAFATWMAFKTIDEWKPEWRMWNNFEPHRAAALALDALSNTHPIYAEVKNAAQATENFDAITYEKGASVVRMLEHYLGAQKFRAGVRAYIRRHRESNAVAADLWRALEKASGQPVGQVAKVWIKQAGFPLVSLSLDPGARPAALAVRQERFLASPITRVPASEAGPWPVPLVVKVGARGEPAPRLQRALVRAGRGRVPLPGGKAPDWFYGNAAEGGFYRVRHDDPCLAALGESLSTALTPVERMGLIGHQWAIVRAGRANLRSFLDLAGRLGGEVDHEVLDTLAAYLAFIDDQLSDAVGPEGRPAFQSWLAEVFGPAWTALGWKPAASEPEERRLRRASVLRIYGIIAEIAGVASDAAERFERYIEDRSSLEPNLAEPLIAIVARDGDMDRFERLRAAVGAARTPQERRRFQLALGDFRIPAAISRALELTLTAEIPTQDVAFLLIRLLCNRVARDTTWTFIHREWDRLGKRLPPMMASRLIEATAALQTRDRRREVATFFRAHPVETGARALRLALERFDVNEEFRRRAGKDLRTWLGARAKAQAGSGAPGHAPAAPGGSTAA